MKINRCARDGSRDSPGRILKVNHAGEYGAVNIYRAQILVGSIYAAGHLDVLRDFAEHEKRHLAIFAAELDRREIRRCRNFHLCGIGGFTLGFLSALLGRRAVMACTAAVETVVLKHLEEQLAALAETGDAEAHVAVAKIIEDEKHHQAVGHAGENRDCIFYQPFVAIIKASTEMVIWLGMKL